MLQQLMQLKMKKVEHGRKLLNCFLLLPVADPGNLTSLDDKESKTLNSKRIETYGTSKIWQVDNLITLKQSHVATHVHIMDHREFH